MYLFPYHEHISVLWGLLQEAASYLDVCLELKNAVKCTIFQLLPYLTYISNFLHLLLVLETKFRYGEKWIEQPASRPMQKRWLTL